MLEQFIAQSCGGDYSPNIYNLFTLLNVERGEFDWLIKRIQEQESFSTDNLTNYEKTLTMLKRRINQ